MLYYIKHEIIGDLVQQIGDGVKARYLQYFLFSFNEKNKLFSIFLTFTSFFFKSFCFCSFFGKEKISKTFYFFFLLLFYKLSTAFLLLSLTSLKIFFIFNILLENGFLITLISLIFLHKYLYLHETKKIIKSFFFVFHFFLFFFLNWNLCGYFFSYFSVFEEMNWKKLIFFIKKLKFGCWTFLGLINVLQKYACDFNCILVLFLSFYS